MDNSFFAKLQTEAVIIEAQTWGSLAYFYVLNNAPNLWIDGNENFVKASFRNRYEVCGPDGKKTLSVHLENGRSQRRVSKKVGIFYGENWQHQHWLALCANYRRSPYFEYYEDDLLPLYEQQMENLFEFNIKTIQFVQKKLSLTFPLQFTQQGIAHLSPDYLDLRSAIKPNKDLPQGLHMMHERKYHQVFEDRNPFFSNLSILDALFNLGPKAAALLV